MYVVLPRLSLPQQQQEEDHLCCRNEPIPPHAVASRHPQSMLPALKVVFCQNLGYRGGVHTTIRYQLQLANWRGDLLSRIGPRQRAGRHLDYLCPPGVG